MVQPKFMRTLHACGDINEITATAADDLGVRDSLVLQARSVRFDVGDVFVSLLDDDVDLASLRDQIVQGDVSFTRTNVITDVFESTFADAMLRDLGTPAQHVQFRQIKISGRPLLQMAIYPLPMSAGGIRLWCDPALVWLFLHDSGARRCWPPCQEYNQHGNDCEVTMGIR